jgi:hypothetical protein
MLHLPRSRRSSWIAFAALVALAMPLFVVPQGGRAEKCARGMSGDSCCCLRHGVMKAGARCAMRSGSSSCSLRAPDAPALGSRVDPLVVAAGTSAASATLRRRPPAVARLIPAQIQLRSLPSNDPPTPPPRRA